MSDALLERAISEALQAALPGVVDALAATGGPRAYSVAQVAERLGVAEATVRRLIHAGHLQTVPHLNPARVAASTLAEFLAGQKRRPLRSAS